jgi:exodeoxyribonuclease V alpha subunit
LDIRPPSTLDFNRLESLHGEVQQIVFNDEETNFTVARLTVAGRPNPVVVVGAMVLAVGETVMAKGLWVDDKKFGRQFKVLDYRATTPATAYAIERYLASGLVKGIGPAFAKRLVARFGLETLEIIEKEPLRLREVSGVGPKRIDRICQAWQTQREIKSVMLFLQGLGISSAFAARIYKQYGDRAVTAIRENPYRMAHEIVGIGFVKADQIARNLGVAAESPSRIRAGMEYLLRREGESGHAFVPADDLIRRAAALLGAPLPLLSESLKTLVAAGTLRAEESSHNGAAIYLPAFHAAETSIPSRLLAILRTAAPRRHKDAAGASGWIQEKLDLKLAEAQKQAVAQALEGKGVIITGGPGTGKTTIVRAIAAIFQAASAKILMAAPTGRAAKRLSEAVGLPAQTIHRMLSYSPQNGFQKNRGQPLDADVLIVDEVSMIDLFLFHHMLQAVPDHAALVLVGDAHQLPSVGPGRVLADLIASRCLPTIELTQIFRQAEKSRIVRNAHRILIGQFPYLPPPGEQAEDFLFIDEEEPARVVEIIQRLASDTLPRRFGFDPFHDIQVISPMNQGLAGATHLNTVLQTALNPRGSEVDQRGRLFRQGDKVMQIANNYEKGVFNGDIGRITRIEHEDREVEVTFDHGRAAYEFGELDELALAYAVSVHKAQGSEYPAVLLPLLPQHYLLLQRTLLYTAVTRAKSLLVLVGSKRAIGMAVRNQRTTQRHSLLADRLISAFRSGVEADG